MTLLQHSQKQRAEQQQKNIETEDLRLVWANLQIEDNVKPRLFYLRGEWIERPAGPGKTIGKVSDFKGINKRNLWSLPFLQHRF
ncbi:hypothetical protein TUM17573_10460 [Klebsiella pneumoniae]|nr:hypothetical protein TUM17573_10460 [Klebsiella pneumoniae]GKM05215.1 hypothetical protein NUBL22820_25430 [Klebsiella pneumoniae]